MKFAIVESGGKQYRAVEGGTIEVDRLPVKAGESIRLDQTLLFADGDNITVGTPVIKDFPVWATVVEHFKGEKVTIFNYSPKKRIRVKTGHRQNYTRLAVEQFGGSEFVKKEPAKAEKKAVKAEPVAEEPKAKAPAKKAPAAKAEKPAEKKTTTKAAPKKAPAKTTTPKAAPKKPAAKAAPKKTAKNE